MAAEDWKGVAMVLSQLGEMAKPSELDIIDRKYELERMEKQADREHQFMLKNFEIAQNQYNELQQRYKSTMNEGAQLDAELNKLQGKPLNFSGEAQKVHNAIYGNQFTNYDAGIKMLNNNINNLQNNIVNAEAINNAGQVADKFGQKFTLTDSEGTITNYAEMFDLDKSGELNYDEKVSAIDQAATDSYGEDDSDAKNAFKIVAKGNIDAEKEMQEQAELDSKLTEEEKLNIAKYKKREMASEQEKIKLNQALSKMPNIISTLQNETAYLNKDGTLNIGKIKQYAKVTNDPRFKAYIDNYEILVEYGLDYLYKSPSLKENDFENRFWGEPDYVTDGYDFASYNLVASGKNRKGEKLERNDYKMAMQQYEWLIENWDKPDDMITINPMTGNEITYKERKTRIKNGLKSIYGIGK
jgi:hypothetical protein